MITLISIDPGVRGTGVALWTPQKIEPLYTHLLQPDPKLVWSQRMNYICDRLENLLYKYKPKDAIIEQPLFLRSRVGIAAAASGNLVKLAMIAGAIMRVCIDYGCTTNTVLPARWKGRKKKEETEKVIRLLLPDLQAKDHNVLDAVGIGLYHKGYIRGGVCIRHRK